MWERASLCKRAYSHKPPVEERGVGQSFCGEFMKKAIRKGRAGQTFSRRVQDWSHCQKVWASLIEPSVGERLVKCSVEEGKIYSTFCVMGNSRSLCKRGSKILRERAGLVKRPVRKDDINHTFCERGQDSTDLL